MINQEWNKTQNDAPFVVFYDMRAVTFVLPDEMADLSIAGLQWFILIPRLNHTGPSDSHSKPYELRGKQPFVSDLVASYDMTQCERFSVA